MIFELYNTFYEFIISHFVFILYFAIVQAIVLSILYFIISSQEIIIRNKTYQLSKKIAFMLIVSIVVIWLVIVATIIWFKRNIPEVKDFYDRIDFKTSWIKEDLDVYFIKNEELIRMKLNGESRSTVFKTDAIIRECHFSFDGNKLSVITNKGLYLINVKDLKIVKVFEMDDSSKQDKLTVSSLRWSPDGNKIFYKINRWKNALLEENVFIYEISTGIYREIKGLRMDVVSPFWDVESRNLYFFKEVSLDTSKRGYPFELNIYKINLNTSNIELITQISQKNIEKPLWYLESQGIRLQADIDDFSFGKSLERFKLASSDGRYLAVDKNDFLYYVRGKLDHKRLFRLPRDVHGNKIVIYKSKQNIDRDNSWEKISLHNKIANLQLFHVTKKDEAEFSRNLSYYWENGELLIDQIRWIPSGKLIVMNLRDWGVLVIDPISLRITTITSLNVDYIGWFPMANKR